MITSRTRTEPAMSAADIAAHEAASYVRRPARLDATTESPRDLLRDVVANEQARPQMRRGVT